MLTSKEADVAPKGLGAFQPGMIPFGSRFKGSSAQYRGLIMTIPILLAVRIRAIAITRLTENPTAQNSSNSN